ncbi:MAG: DUF2442 domain-containing protein, partial [Nitrospirae bacterium]|nr:DUF2442 domain-containing protein [Nitrospirota bacterium]
MKKYHDVSDIRFEEESLFINIDGEKLTFKLKEISHILDRASETERKNFEISPSCYGIHWPLLDED